MGTYPSKFGLKKPLVEREILWTQQATLYLLSRFFRLEVIFCPFTRTNANTVFNRDDEDFLSPISPMWAVWLLADMIILALSS